MTTVAPEGQAASGGTGDDVLRAEHIAKRFGAVTTLVDINLHLACGEVLALLGDNGAGKLPVIMAQRTPRPGGRSGHRVR